MQSEILCKWIYTATILLAKVQNYDTWPNHQQFSCGKWVETSIFPLQLSKPIFFYSQTFKCSRVPWDKLQEPMYAANISKWLFFFWVLIFILYFNSLFHFRKSIVGSKVEISFTVHMTKLWTWKKNLKLTFHQTICYYFQTQWIPERLHIHQAFKVRRRFLKFRYCT